MRDAYGEVAIYLLPYLKPALVRHSAPEAEIATYQDAVSYALQQWTVPPSRRNVLVAHQFVILTAPARMKSEILSKLNRPEVQIIAKSNRISKKLELFYFSLRVGTAVLCSLALLSFARHENHNICRSAG